MDSSSMYDTQTPDYSVPSPSVTDSPPVTSESTNNHTVSSQHVTRPPNSFLLFRSDFLRKQIIPASVEAKQHNLSRIVADCWNRMTDDEQQVWKNVAKEKEMEHARAHPGYVYKPHRDKSRRNKTQPAKRRRKAMSTEEEIKRCNGVRVEYVPEMTGPVLHFPRAKPTRKRKSRAKRGVATVPQPSHTEGHPPPSPANLDRLVFTAPAFVDLPPLPEATAPAPGLVTPQSPLNAVARIRENYDIARRSMIFNTATATDIQATQSLYTPDQFFISPGIARCAKFLPPFAPPASEPRGTSSACSLGCLQNSESAPTFKFPYTTIPSIPPTGLEDFEALSSPSSPQPFPMTLMASTSMPHETLQLRPPVFDKPPRSLENLTFSLNKRGLEVFSSEFGVDDQFGLFGELPGLGVNLDSAPTPSTGPDMGSISNLSPHAFPMTLRASTSTPLETLQLRPPVFDTPTKSLDTLTLSFDKRNLESFSAEFGVDDQFGLFGEPPGFGFDSNSSPTRSASCAMDDILNLEVCSQKD